MLELIHRRFMRLKWGEVRSMSLAGNILGSGRTRMGQFCLVLAVAIATFAPNGLTQQIGPYKVLKTARVGGEGGRGYIYADVAGRRLYIPRRGTPVTKSCAQKWDSSVCLLLSSRDALSAL